MENQTNIKQALDLIKQSDRILIAPSTPMDGDSIGSAIALMLVLKKLGKEVSVVSTESCPDYLSFLPYTNKIESQLQASKDFIISLDTNNAEVDHMKYEVEQGKLNLIITPKTGQFSPSEVSFPGGTPHFDLIITVDTGDLVQLGKLYESNKRMFESTPLLNIDHHSSNSKFGTHNLLDYSVAATTQIIARLFDALEKEGGEKLYDEDIATLLLTGIITDTGSFQHSNTSPEAFEAAANLLDRGARQQEVIKHIFKTKSLATLKLWGRVLSKIRYDEKYHFVYSTITQKDLEETGATSDDSGGIIDELMSNAPKAEVVLLLKEKEPGFVSGSLRAPGDLADVSEVAGLMGGGGHKKAAGFRIREKTMDEALDYAISNISSYMEKKLFGETKPVNEEQTIMETGTKVFPNLVLRPNTSIPKPSPGGEDMLLEDFKKRRDPEEEKIREKSVHFFQDSDGQEASAQPESANEMTVGDVLSQLSED